MRADRARPVAAATTRYVALLRAVNVGGHNLLAMSALKAMLEDMGLTRVQTLLQSGNVVFDCAAVPGGELERRLALATEQRLRVDTEFFVRSAPEWAQVIASNPLVDQARSAPSQLLVMCLQHEPDLAKRLALEAAPAGGELVRVVGRQAYVWYPHGAGKSRLKLPVLATGRNWNTVQKLATLLQG